MRAARRRRLLGILLFVSLGLARGEADACSCITPQPPCAAVWETDAIFRGRVIAITPATLASPGAGPFGPTSGLHVTFTLDETLHGTLAGTQVEVFTEADESACGYSFTKNADYIVYAYRGGEGRPLSTSRCSRTRPVQDAAEDLAYLRALRTQPETMRTRISGRVTKSDEDYDRGPYREYPPPAGLPVLLKRPDGLHALRTETDAEGAFAFDDQPVGRYRVALDLPETLIAAVPAIEVDLRSRQACADASFHIWHNGRLAGRVVDAAGAGVAGASVGVLSAARVNDRWMRVKDTVSSSDGSFEVDGVPPGRYLLGINLQRLPRSLQVAPRIFYPGTLDPADARVFALRAGERVIVGTFTLPASGAATPAPR